MQKWISLKAMTTTIIMISATKASLLTINPSILYIIIGNSVENTCYFIRTSYSFKPHSSIIIPAGTDVNLTPSQTAFGHRMSLDHYSYWLQKKTSVSPADSWNVFAPLPATAWEDQVGPLKPSAVSGQAWGSCDA